MTLKMNGVFLLLLLSTKIEFNFLYLVDLR